MPIIEGPPKKNRRAPRIRAAISRFMGFIQGFALELTLIPLIALVVTSAMQLISIMLQAQRYTVDPNLFTPFARQFGSSSPAVAYITVITLVMSLWGTILVALERNRPWTPTPKVPEQDTIMVRPIPTPKGRPYS